MNREEKRCSSCFRFYLENELINTKGSLVCITCKSKKKSWLHIILTILLSFIAIQFIRHFLGILAVVIYWILVIIYLAN